MDNVPVCRRANIDKLFAHTLRRSMPVRIGSSVPDRDDSNVPDARQS